MMVEMESRVWNINNAFFYLMHSCNIHVQILMLLDMILKIITKDTKVTQVTFILENIQITFISDDIRYKRLDNPAVN